MCVRPELVVEIALDGVQRSTRYPGGVALRFARVKRYREDKTPADADTIETIRSLLPGGTTIWARFFRLTGISVPRWPGGP